MRQGCVSSLFFLLLRRKAERDSTIVKKIALEQHTESPGAAETMGAGAAIPLTNTAETSGVWSLWVCWSEPIKKSSCTNVVLLCDEWISSSVIYEMTKWGQSGKRQAGAHLYRRAWLKDNPVGRSSGNAAMVKSSWTFYKTVGNKRKDKAIVSLFPSAWRVKKNKNKRD